MSAMGGKRTLAGLVTRSMLRPSHSLTIFALACALFLRVWVPAGWMPSANGGAFAIEPCSAAASAPMSHASHHGSQHKGQHDGDCSFAPHHAGAAPAELAPAIIAPVAIAEALPQISLTAFFPTGPPAPPPPATGPPSLA